MMVKTCQDLEMKLRVPMLYTKHSKSASWVTWSYGSKVEFWSILNYMYFYKFSINLTSSYVLYRKKKRIYGD